MNMNSLTVFFGWCTVINFVILTVSTILVVVFSKSIEKLHSKIFKINPDDVALIYYKYLGGYKIGIILLNLTPYIALKMMA